MLYVSLLIIIFSIREYNARYRPYTLEERAAACGPTFDLRTRYILGYILRRNTTREFPSFDPEKGILIIAELADQMHHAALTGALTDNGAQLRQLEDLLTPLIDNSLQGGGSSR